MGSGWAAQALLCATDDDDGSLVLRRIREAIGLIERSAAFEGHGELAAAHLALSDAARHLSEQYAAHAVKTAPGGRNVRLQMF
jgi:hypothetical protein